MPSASARTASAWPPPPMTGRPGSGTPSPASNWHSCKGTQGRCLTCASDATVLSLATASADGTARVWDAGSGQQLALLQGHRSLVLGVSFSPDGARLATASYDKAAQIWDISSGKQLALLQGHTGVVRSVSFSPDGARLATASFDGTVRSGSPMRRRRRCSSAAGTVGNSWPRTRRGPRTGPPPRSSSAG